MAFISTGALDALLNHVRTKATKLHICSAGPTSFANVAAVSLGTKASPVLSVPAAGTPNGRKITVSAISDGAVTVTGTASHWALVDETGSELLAWNTLVAAQVVTNGNSFTLGAFDIRQPDAA